MKMTPRLVPSLMFGIFTEAASAPGSTTAGSGPGAVRDWANSLCNRDWVRLLMKSVQ